MTASLILFISNDNIIELDNLYNPVDAQYENAATVTVTLYQGDGVTEVTGQSWPATMAHVTESPDQGKYRATLENDLSLSANDEYIAEIAVTGPGVANWKVAITPQYRGIHD